MPFPFECEYACIVDDYEEVERRIHSAFTGNRVNPKREFFEISPLRIIDILELLNPERIDVQTEYEDKSEKQASEIAVKKNNRRANFKFSDYSIPVGTQLFYLYDDNIICTVMENNKVEYQGDISSLSALTLKILTEKGFKGTSANGYAYWSLDKDGDSKESLYEYRRRLDSMDNDD